MTLDQLKVGQTAVITEVNGTGELRLHLLDMGLIPKTKVTVYKVAPLGDPIEIHLRSYSMTLRKEDAANIVVSLKDGELR